MSLALHNTISSKSYQWPPKATASLAMGAQGGGGDLSLKASSFESCDYQRSTKIVSMKDGMGGAVLTWDGYGGTRVRRG